MYATAAFVLQPVLDSGRHTPGAVDTKCSVVMVKSSVAKPSTPSLIKTSMASVAEYSGIVEWCPSNSGRVR